MSTAAAAEVKVKQDRRQEWDRKIEELETSLNESRDSPSAQIHDAGQIESYDTSPMTHTTHVSLLDYIPYAQVRTAHKGILPDHVDLRNFETKEWQTDALKRFLFTPEKEAMFHKAMAAEAKVTPWSIYASDQQKKNRKSFTPKKMLTIEYSVAKLVAQLMLATSNVSSERQVVLDGMVSELSEQLLRVKSAEAFDTGNLERPSFPQYNPDSAMMFDEVHNFNRILLRLCQTCLDGRISIPNLLTKTAYNLLVSPVAPDMVTYIQLINTYSRLGLADHTDMIIESLIETHLRHNEVSVDSILSHYIRHRDADRFHWWVLKVQGYWHGLQRAHPDEVKDGTVPSRHRLWDGRVLESIDLTPRVCNTILRGYRSFFYADEARQWEEVMDQAKFTQDVASLLGPLSQCVRDHDWEAGYRIWGFVRQSISNIDLSLQIRPEHEAAAYQMLLKLCRYTGNLDDFRDIYWTALDRGFTMDEVLMNSSRRERLRAHISSIRDKQRRRLEVAQRRLQAIQERVRYISIQALGDKILRLKLRPAAAKQLFTEKGIGHLWDAWAEERPWMMTDILKRPVNLKWHFETQPQENAIAEFLEFRPELDFEHGSDGDRVSTSWSMRPNLSRTVRKRLARRRRSQEEFFEVYETTLDSKKDSSKRAISTSEAQPANSLDARPYKVKTAKQSVARGKGSRGTYEPTLDTTNESKIPKSEAKPADSSDVRPNKRKTAKQSVARGEGSRGSYEIHLEIGDRSKKRASPMPGIQTAESRSFKPHEPETAEQRLVRRKGVRRPFYRTYETLLDNAEEVEKRVISRSEAQSTSGSWHQRKALSDLQSSGDADDAGTRAYAKHRRASERSPEAKNEPGLTHKRSVGDGNDAGSMSHDGARESPGEPRRNRGQIRKNPEPEAGVQDVSLWLRHKRLRDIAKHATPKRQLRAIAKGTRLKQQQPGRVRMNIIANVSKRRSTPDKSPISAFEMGTNEVRLET